MSGIAPRGDSATRLRGEFTLIERIRSKVRTSAGTLLGIGDDCAALAIRPGSQLLVTTDMLMDGVHFRLDEATPDQAGYKAMAVNLSDIAAMAGVPRAAVVAVALPREKAEEVAAGLLRGMTPLIERFGVDLVGGDTNAWSGPLVVSVTIFGETASRGPVARSGAKPGDAIFVTGALGGSLLGRHLRPEPRVSEALALHEAANIHAMIDISDGLGADLGHILEESGNLGATLDAASIPIHPDALSISKQDGRGPLDHALSDGEDFELCFAIDGREAELLLAQVPAGITLHRIGRIEPEPGLRLRNPDGTVIPLAAGGFDHLSRWDV